MKSFQQAITMGLISAIAVFISSYFQLPIWVLFMAWVSYYLFDMNLKSALTIFTQQVLGILIAIIIQYGGTELKALVGDFGFPIIIFIIMSGVFYISKLKHFNNIPAYFLGMIVWFGSSTPYSINRFLLLGITLIMGYIFAWINVVISGRIELKHQSNE